MAKDFKVALKVVSDADKAIKQMSKLEQATGFTKKQFLAMGVAVTAASAAVVYGMAKAINAASDFQETQSKFDVVFANQKMLAEDFSNTLVEGYAMSEREAKANLSAMQDLLVPMGVASDKAAIFSNEIVKLSADLGSFNNLPTAQVMIDMQSALVGNFETMKKYGVVLNATRVQQKALEMGLKDTKEELTAGDKAIAAYNLILAGSTAAVGDMERTSQGFANQMKFLKAKIEDVTVTLGNELLPAATTLIIEVSTAVSRFAKWSKESENLKQSLHIVTGIMLIFVDVIKDIVKISASIITSIGKMANMAGFFTKMFKGAAMSTEIFNTVTQNAMKSASKAVDDAYKSNVNSAKSAQAEEFALMDSKFNYIQEKLIEEQGLKDEFAMQEQMNDLFLIDTKKGVMQSYYDWNAEKLAEQAAKQQLFTDQVKALHKNMQSALTSGFAASMKDMLDNGANFAKVMTTISNAIRDVFINMIAEVAAKWVMSHGLMTAATLAWKGITLLANAAVAAASAAVSAFKAVPFPFNIAAAAAAAYGAYALVEGYFATGIKGFGGGLAMVGERGPEMISAPVGSNVLNNGETRNMLSKDNGGASKVINLNVSFSGNSFLGAQEETIDMITGNIMQNIRLQANV